MNDEDKTFFRYFVKTYIPRFTKPIPHGISPTSFSEMLTSTFDVWQVMERLLPTLSISDELKRSFVALFSNVDALYEEQLIADYRGLSFRSWLAQASVQMRWKEMQHISSQMQRLSQKYL